MTEERIKFEGPVAQTSYNGLTSLDFPNGYLLIRLGKESGHVDDERTLILNGVRTPPIQRGHYVNGKAIQRNLGEKGIVFLVDDLNVFDRNGGNLLFDYSIRLT